MAKGARTRGRSAPRRWLWRLAALAALFGLAFAAWLWWDMRDWRPDPGAYPEQGALVPAGAAPVRFETLKAIGAQFVYLPLEPGAGREAPGGFADPPPWHLTRGAQLRAIRSSGPCGRCLVTDVGKATILPLCNKPTHCRRLVTRTIYPQQVGQS